MLNAQLRSEIGLFTDINSLGLIGLFKDDEVAKIVSIADQINENAQVVAG